MKYLSYFAIFCLFYITVGCSDFLSETPTAHQSTSNYYKSASDARRAINAVYRQMADPIDYNHYAKTVFGDIMSDNAAKGGGGATDQARALRLKRFEAKPSNTAVENAWQENFKGVYLANVVFDRIPSIDMDDQKKKEILAEAHFLRGYFYLQLVRLFGNVPLIKKPLKQGKYNQPQVSPNKIWAFIEQEMSSAAVNLPMVSDLANDQLGRATKGAAQSLLLNTYMWQKKWDKAQQLADKIINSGRYRLDPDFNHIWVLDGEFGSGSIFEINYATIPNKGVGSTLPLWEGSRSGWGFGFVLPTQDLFDAFEKDDPRLKATIITNNQRLPDGTIANTSESTTGYESRKYWLPQSKRPINNGAGKYESPTNERVYRLAEIMLWGAEASVHNGNIPHATDLVNRVRARARKSGNITDSSVLPPYNSVSLQNVYHEERVEQALGAHRRFYNLVRTGRAADVLPNYKEGINNHIPIPLREVQLSDGVLKQNPGY